MVQGIKGMFTRAAGLLAMLFVLGACTEYAYIPPATLAGQACVSQCGFERQQCQFFANDDYQQCMSSRNFALASYNRCVRSGRRGCVQPSTCFNQSFRCSGQYDGCFRACGGRIEEIKPRR